jgi:P4 family phage/plasmid primase-like protien
MNMFHGVHEVRVRRPAIAVGYFDSYEAALRAIENEPEYVGAYFTLNPLKLPDGFPAQINPPSLARAYRTAEDGDVERRVWLLIDLDPARPTGTNSTEAEKQTAREQAEHVREYLTGRGWPAPLLCDSGNGWHLLYRVELPNDDSSTALVRGILGRLKQLFPLVDLANYNASRICKAYGSWARKGEHTEERPWRRSAIVEAPETRPVSPEQLSVLAAEYQGDVTPVPSPVGDAASALEKLMGFLGCYDVDVHGRPRTIRNGHQIEITCPWQDEHSTDSPRDTVVSCNEFGYGFKCQHGHCAGRHWREFRAELERRFPDRKYAFTEAGPSATLGSLPLIAHATLAEAFLRDNHDFCAVYDAPGRPTAQWVKTRWDVSGDDTILWRAVADYLKALHDRYRAPEKGPDSRMRLYDATFINGVVRCVKPYLPPVKAEAFDREPYMLGLPECRVIDLRTGAVRDMRREDYISQRIDVTPDPNCPTPRFDRFIGEITCGDGALANYLLRLCALCLTADPYQGLFFLWGRGRNGKGVLIRMMTAILGDGRFAWPLRPSEITVFRFGDDGMKRTFAGLKGKRLVTVSESVSGNLNLSMLKLMSGGDTLSAAHMRQDAVAFKPTHKVLLPTNERPQLPADPAFRGRVHMIPFLANFTGREDRSLDETLQHVELPGILYRLTTLCPDVIENGLRPPASVLAETDQLFAELDVTKQFRDDCLENETGAETTAGEMKAAIAQWLHGQMKSGALVVSVGGSDTEAETIMRELKHQPDIKYIRVRRDGDRSERDGKGRVWAYVGVRLK